MVQTNDLRIAGVRPLISPEALKREFPISDEQARFVLEGRNTIDNILRKNDPRMMAIVGPCSIHDPASALEYAAKLAELKKMIEDRIFVVMRVYFEKPRTTLGWRGLIVDPDLDGSYDIEKGLKKARRLLLEIIDQGLPVGSEMLDPIVPQYIADTVSWAAIGARTTESQTHREMASGLSMPVGFKNGTSGNLQLAIDAVKSSRSSHSFIGIDQEGRTCVLRTTGNPDGHMILRGGRSGPNYHEENVEEAETLFREAGLEPSLVVDCSHANSGKDHTKQERVLRSVIDQRTRGRSSLVGFMLESNIAAGSQKLSGERGLAYGCSITDNCVGWEETEEMLRFAYERLTAVYSR
ncbi:MAG: 3-deoxy-7-phosphoheptulonate synthase [Spirochaetia bacterium]